MTPSFAAPKLEVKEEPRSPPIKRAAPRSVGDIVFPELKAEALPSPPRGRLSFRHPKKSVPPSPKKVKEEEPAWISEVRNQALHRAPDDPEEMSGLIAARKCRRTSFRQRRSHMPWSGRRTRAATTSTSTPMTGTTTKDGMTRMMAAKAPAAPLEVMATMKSWTTTSTGASRSRF
jgi:hypothetical protein